MRLFQGFEGIFHAQNFPVYDSEGNLLNPIKSGIATKPIPLPNPNDFQVIYNGSGDEKADSKRKLFSKSKR